MEKWISNLKKICLKVLYLKKIIILMFVLIIVEMYFMPAIMTKLFQSEYRDITDCVVRYGGYEINGNQYLMNDVDPQIECEFKSLYISDAIIRFETPLEEDFLGTLYYAQNGGYSEEHSIGILMKKGSRSAHFFLKGKECNSLRLDLDGNFVLDRIELAYIRDPLIKKIAAYFLALFIDLILLGVILYSQSKKNFLYLSYRFLISIYENANKKLWDFFVRKKINLSRVFLFIAIGFGCIYSVLLSPGQIPDEPAHITYITTAFGVPKAGQEINNLYSEMGIDWDTLTNPSMKNDIQKIRDHYARCFSNEARKLNGKFSIAALKYLPMGMGLLLAIFLDLPILISLQFAEICSVIFYTALGYFTIKKMPVMKITLFLIMTLPMTLQQCSSLNYDAELLPICFFMLSYILNCAYEKEKVSWKEVFIVIVLAFFLALIKLPYVLLILLVFMIPKEKLYLPIGKKLDLWKYISAYKYLCIFLLTILMVLIGFTKRNYYMVLYLRAIVSMPKEMIRLFSDTFSKFFRFYCISTIGNFAWLRAPISQGYVLIVAILLLISAIFGRGDTEKVTLKRRIAFMGIAICIIFLIEVAMINHSYYLHNIQPGTTLYSAQNALKQISLIEGVQGRYFIPVLPLVFLSIGSELKGRLNILPGMALSIYFYVYPIYFLLHRFWF